MASYISVDCGKYNTKACAFDGKSGSLKKFKFRTKVGEGTFEDDMFEKGTFIVQVDGGTVYKVGNGGRNEPELETTKKTEIHRICTLAGAAMAAGNDGKDGVDIVIGIPLQVANIPEERIAYKDYILGGEGTVHTVKLKKDPSSEPVEIKLEFKRRLVYPEGLGALYEYPQKVDGPTAIIDIGNLNTNNTYAEGFTVNMESCFTDELGGKVLISGLAQELTSELGMRCDDNLAASTLLRPLEARALRPKNGDKAVAEKSRSIINNYLLEHVRAIKRKCDTRHWPLDFMNIICIGGTAKLLSHEIEEVFGENTFIPDSPEYVNACGFLKKMCADAGVDISAASGSTQDNA